MDQLSSKASQPSEARARLAGQQASAFSPREIVSELDRFIIGQNDAKRAVAIALRNRWRRRPGGKKLGELEQENAETALERR